MKGVMPAAALVSAALAAPPAGPAAKERAALLQLYHAAGGGGWLNTTGWDAGDGDVCGWFGVTCDAAGRVAELTITRNNLTGTLPDALGDLTELTNLTLNFGALSGTLPGGLARLTRLRRMWLNTHTLSDPAAGIGGGIDVLTAMPWLVEMDLSFNKLSGSIPDGVAALTNATNLELESNQLSGTIPTAIGSMSSLRTLALFSNKLSGPVPDLPYSQFDKYCFLGGTISNHYDCPLPASAADCHYGGSSTGVVCGK